MFNIYCDGGCSGNPGPGGYGMVVMNDNNDIVIEKFSDYSNMTTNNIEELKGLIRSLEYCQMHPQDKFIIWVDSAYAIGCIVTWAPGWENNNWTRPKGKEIKNLDLVKKGYYLYSILQNCEIRKIKGHSGIIGNELADKLTKK